jgi:hypothetical protein
LSVPRRPSVKRSAKRSPGSTKTRRGELPNLPMLRRRQE